MPRTEPTLKEQAFALDFFKTQGRNRANSMRVAGYPVVTRARALNHADRILQRPRIQAYLRHLWEKAESPVVMSVRERTERLSELGRGNIGDLLDDDGNVDIDAIRNMPAVKEVTIQEDTVGIKNPITRRTIRVKMLNPVEPIHELNIMDKLLNRGNDRPGNEPVVNNYFLIGEDTEGKIARIGDRTRKAIDVASEVVNEVKETSRQETEEVAEDG